jgi:UDP-N-acetylmuramyl tripeptide synthase
LATPSGERAYPLIHDSRINVANETGAIAVLSEFGVSGFDAALGKVKVTTARYDEYRIGGLPVVEIAAKSANPVAVSAVFRQVAAMPGRKAVIVAYDDVGEFDVGSENTSWYYDTDFEALNDPSLTSILFAGPRHLDAVARAHIAGVNPALIRSTAVEGEAAAIVDLSGVDQLLLLRDVYLQNSAAAIRAGLRRRLEGKA